MKHVVLIAALSIPVGCGGPTPLVGHLDLAEVGTRTEGQFFDSNLGITVAAPGDLDGDGRAELVLGIWHERVVDSPSVMAISWPPPSVAEVGSGLTEVRGIGAGRIQRVGDLDGDGTDELLLGTRLFYGPPPAAIDRSLPGAWIVEVRSGTVTTGFEAGDQDGDGLDDLWLAAPWDRSSGDPWGWNSRQAGAVYLLSGPIPDGADLARADAAVVGDGSSDQLGSVAFSADTDADGELELVAADSYRRIRILDGPWQGERHVDDAGVTLELDPEGCSPVVVPGRGDLVGGPGHDLVATHWPNPTCGDLVSIVEADGGAGAWTLHGGDEPPRAQPVVALPGDLDGDGFDDLVVGDPNHDGPDDAWAYGRGQVRIFYGPLQDETTWDDADAVLDGELIGDGAGRTLTAIGDMDGDGLPDVAVGAPAAIRNPDGDARGTVYVLRGARRP